MTTLYVRDGEQFQIAAPCVILDRAQALIAQRFRAGTPAFTVPDRTREFLRLKLGSLEHEVFSVLFLDSRHHLIEYVELFRGTVDLASVYPREVVKEALARNAVAVILSHCHPSGDPTPSQADREITQTLKDALQLFQIRVIDHIIVAGPQFYSFAEAGLL